MGPRKTTLIYTKWVFGFHDSRIVGGLHVALFGHGRLNWRKWKDPVHHSPGVALVVIACPRNLIILNSAISACEKGRRWSMACRLPLGSQKRSEAGECIGAMVSFPMGWAWIGCTHHGRLASVCGPVLLSPGDDNDAKGNWRMYT